MPERRVLRRDAHAKINAFLRVVKRRRDGYHEIQSLVLPVSLADRVTLRRAAALRLHVEPSGEVPAGPTNLALIAALALVEVCEGAGGADIQIRKRIAVAAGLGGGSADAATVLLGLNELWGCKLSSKELAAVAERIGSDVPSLLAGRPVLMSGRGETLRPAKVETTWWVLRPLPLEVRSPDAYRWWDEDRAPSGPDPTPLLRALARGSVERLGRLLFNDLDEPVVRRHPEVAEAKQGLLDAGALGAVMSGSGPTLAALARDREHAVALARRFRGAKVVQAPPAPAASRP